jgi:redox-sensing transcriptional repressor
MMEEKTLVKKKTENRKVSASVIKRLPRYFRYLSDLLASGVNRISSKELARLMGITDSQIRQDLNCFGGFGQQGYGYNIELLYGAIKNILGVDNERDAIIIGCGNLGRALASKMNFARRGVRLIGLFDNSPAVVGEKINGLEILDVSCLKAFCEENMPEIAILTLPKTATAEIAEILVEYGIKGLWNFANTELRQVENIKVENVHLGDSLMMLCHSLKEAEENG